MSSGVVIFGSHFSSDMTASRMDASDLTGVSTMVAIEISPSLKMCRKDSVAVRDADLGPHDSTLTYMELVDTGPRGASSLRQPESCYRRVASCGDLQLVFHSHDAGNFPTALSASEASARDATVPSRITRELSTITAIPWPSRSARFTRLSRIF